MSKPIKNLLVYADGRVEDAGTELLGVLFIKMENVDGDWWRREFEIRLAHDGHQGGPEQGPKTCSMVGIEREFRLYKTREEIAREDAERRAEVMRQCLWGIANCPERGE